jgi:hypothetical protein
MPNGTRISIASAKDGPSPHFRGHTVEKRCHAVDYNMPHAEGELARLDGRPPLLKRLTIEGV